MPAIRTDPPDEGNIHLLLELLGTDDQKAEWLQPLVDGDLTSAFAMTEPMQGGGADPTMIKTTAEKDGDEWVINGHKWWITNGSDADFLLVMARTDPDVHPYEGVRCSSSRQTRLESMSYGTFRTWVRTRYRAFTRNYSSMMSEYPRRTSSGRSMRDSSTPNSGWFPHALLDRCSSPEWPNAHWTSRRRS